MGQLDSRHAGFGFTTRGDMSPFDRVIAGLCCGLPDDDAGCGLTVDEGGSQHSLSSFECPIMLGSASEVRGCAPFM